MLRKSSDKTKTTRALLEATMRKLGENLGKDLT